MHQPLHLNRVQAAFLLLNVFVLGGCVVLLLVSGPSVPLILLTVGALGMAVAKIAQGFKREGASEHVERGDQSPHGIGGSTK